MKLTLRDVKNHGDQNKERVVIDVLEDCDTADYILFDTTYDDEGEISNEVRHAFLFPSVKVKEDDIIRVYTRKGQYNKFVSDNGTPHHDFYWGLDEPIWNDTGDCALLIEVADRETLTV